MKKKNRKIKIFQATAKDKYEYVLIPYKMYCFKNFYFYIGKDTKGRNALFEFETGKCVLTLGRFFPKIILFSAIRLAGSILTQSGVYERTSKVNSLKHFDVFRPSWANIENEVSNAYFYESQSTVEGD